MSTVAPVIGAWMRDRTKALIIGSLAAVLSIAGCSPTTEADGPSRIAKLWGVSDCVGFVVAAPQVNDTQSEWRQGVYLFSVDLIKGPSASEVLLTTCLPHQVLA